MQWTHWLDEHVDESPEAKRWILQQCHMEDMSFMEDFYKGEEEVEDKGTYAKLSATHAIKRDI